MLVIIDVMNPANIARMAKANGSDCNCDCSGGLPGSGGGNNCNCRCS